MTPAPRPNVWPPTDAFLTIAGIPTLAIARPGNLLATVGVTLIVRYTTAMNLRVRRAAWTALALVAILECAGCTTTIVPPIGPLVDPVTVFLVDYGRHSSLVLPEQAPVGGPSAQGPAGAIEYAYGEWWWYARNKDQWYDLPRTMLLPSQGTLGRRRLNLRPTIEALSVAIGCEAVYRIRVEADDAYKLRDRLAERFNDHIDTKHYNPRYDLSFVHHDESYSLLHNCNQVALGWLTDLGCRVRGLGIWADFRIVAPPGPEKESSL